MEKKILYLILIINIIVGKGIYSQSVITSNEYINNKTALSYAYSGFYGNTNASISYKANWLGFQGAPEYLKGGFDIPMPYNSGFGISMMNYRVGIFSDFNANIDYAFKVPVANEHHLYFGLRAQFYRSSVNYNKTKLTDFNDPALSYNLRSDATNKINSSFAVAYNWDYLFAGFTINNLSKKEIKIGNQYFPVHREFKFFSNYKYQINKEFEIEGFGSINKFKESKAFIELTATGRYNEDFWFGLSWRRPVNFAVNVGSFLTKEIYINYTVGITGAPGYANNLGSHEINLGYRLSTGSKWFVNSSKKSNTLIEKIIELISSLFGK